MVLGVTSLLFLVNSREGGMKDAESSKGGEGEEGKTGQSYNLHEESAKGAGGGMKDGRKEAQETQKVAGVLREKDATERHAAI
jgi:hypothetical protein